MISIICCSNKPEIAQSMLINSLNKQTLPYEMILIDNSKNQFSSAAKALNYGAEQATGNILVFVHQDVEFLDSYGLDIIKNSFNQLGPNVIIGAAGVVENQKVYTNIIQGDKRLDAGEYKVEVPVEVQTLDEVLIALHKNIFNSVKFNEQLCNGWHLYGVNLSLEGKMKNIKSYVIPLNLYHKSTGKLSLEYAWTFFKLLRKHRTWTSKVSTTCTTSSTKTLRSIQYTIQLIWDHVIIGR